MIGARRRACAKNRLGEHGIQGLQQILRSIMVPSFAWLVCSFSLFAVSFYLCRIMCKSQPMWGSIFLKFGLRCCFSYFYVLRAEQALSFSSKATGTSKSNYYSALPTTKITSEQTSLHSGSRSLTWMLYALHVQGTRDVACC